MSSRSAGRREGRIYFFDIVHDYPEIGGVVEYSTRLFDELKRLHGDRLISVRNAVAGLSPGLTDTSVPYLDREAAAARALAALDPHSTFLFPNFQSPIPRTEGACRPKVVNIVHDIQFKFLPQYFAAPDLAWLDRAFANTRANADEVLFVSETSRRHFHRFYGYPEREAVIHAPIAVSDRRCVQSPGRATPYLLATGHHANHPHKNFAGLLRFFARLRSRVPGLELVLTGHGRDAFATELHAVPEDVRQHVEHLGYVSRERLDGLYGDALAFVSLSQFEGFNMPAAEAACHRTPLLLSDLPAHRELFSDQALFIEGDTVDLDRVLAHTASTRAEWALRSSSRPDNFARNVSDRVLSLSDSATADARTGRSSTALRGGRRTIPFGVAGHLAAANRNPSSIWAGGHSRAALLASVALAGALFALAPHDAWAQQSVGGTGGGSGGGVGGGFDSPGGAATGDYFGGGGGGSAASTTTAQPGGAAFNGGGPGGAGGTAGAVGSDTILSTGASATGANGAAGANSSYYFGGGGGAGGYGAIVTSPANATTTGKTFQGGAGGSGGAGAVSGGGGPSGPGNGGDGGLGVFLEQGGQLTTIDTITGGQGGNGGPNSGSAGKGGTGLLTDSAAMATITNSGAITGGMGGTTGSITGGSAGPASGNGGVGLYLGGGGSVVNTTTGSNIGSIRGGVGGTGVTPSGSYFGTGGAGGTGVVLLTGGIVTNNVNTTIVGGAGGLGSFGGYFGGGTGGVGGIGVNTLGGGSVTNAGSIAGGAGGAGNSGGYFGSGGAGGVGINVAAGGTIVNTGSISGGAGGVGFAAIATGGIGVAFAGDGTVTTSGAINAGVNNPGGAITANALEFYAGTHTLTLQTGFSFNSNVVVRTDLGGVSASNTLNLDGSSTGTVNLPKFLNFGHFTQSGGGGGSWTLAGAGTFTVDASVSAGTLGFADGATITVPIFTLLSGGTLSLSTGAPIAAVGTLAFNGGTLQVTGTAYTSLTNAVTWGANGGGFDIAAAAATFTVPQALNGGPLTKSGAGTLVLTGTDTFNGTSVINAGTLQVGAGGTVGSITGNVLNNGTLAFNRTDGVSFGGVISGSGAVRQAGTGTLTLSGVNTYSGGTTVAAGTLVGSATSFGSGPIVDNAALVINQPTDASFANPISGTGSLTKQGTGRLNLTGTSPLTGPTTISAGTLAVNGSLAGSIVTIANGGALAGTGTVGGIVAQGGGAVGPGNSIGQLNVAGNVAFAPGSAYQVELNAAGAADKIQATGTATITGGTVQVTAAAGVYSPALVYTILTAAGGRTGTFTNLTSTANLAFLSPALAYDANNVFIVFTQNGVGFVSVAQTPNQANAGAAIQALGAGALFNAVLGSTAANAQRAFDVSSGEIHASAVTAQFVTADLIRNAILDRLRGGFATGVGYGPDPGFGAMPGGATVPSAYSADLPGGVRTSRVPMTILDPQVFALWGLGFGSFGSTRSDGNAARLTRNTGGFILGADLTLDGTYRFGLAGGYTNTDINVANRLSRGSIESGFGAIYFGAALGAFSARLGAEYAGNSLGIVRNVAFPGFADSERSRYGSTTGQVFGEFGYRFGFGPGYLEPIVGASGIRIDRDRFLEVGGPAALVGASRLSELGTATVGVRGEVALGETSPFSVRGLVGYRRAFGDIVPTALLAFAAGAGGPFTVAGIPIDRNAFVAEAGVDWRIAAGMTVGLSYTGQVGPRAHDHGLKGDFVWKF